MTPAWLFGDAKLPFGWRLLLNRFPNIQKLGSHLESGAVGEFVDCVEEMFKNPARRPNLPFTDLRLKVSVPGPIKRLLQMPQLKLKVLNLSLYRSTGDDDDDKFFDTLQTAMQLHGNTLKELHLENRIKSMGFLESLRGNYTSLTKLQMKGAALAFSFQFLHKLPNLKVLRVEQDSDERMLMATNWSALERMPHLREFYFIVTRSEAFLCDEILDRFAELMPNLESFTAQLENLTIRVVCRNWRQLRKLVILSGWGLDGVDPTNLGDLLDIDDVAITGIVPESDERVPCIADLQELRHLTLQHVTNISDASVFDGFLRLPHLASLDICEINRIYMDGLEALKRRLQGGFTITIMYP